MVTFILQLLDPELADVHNYKTGIPTLAIAKEMFNEDLQLAVDECYGCNRTFNRVLNPTIWRLLDSNGNEIERYNFKFAQVKLTILEQNDKTKPVNLKGGRGERAPYQTTHVRVPEPIKAVVDKLIGEYRQAVVTNNEQLFLDNLNQLIDKQNTENESQAVIEATKDNFNDRLNAISDVIKAFKVNSKTTRDWTQANKLIARLNEVLEGNE